MGFGTNMVTGDYSRGATGLWIENGAADPRRRRGDHRRQPGRDADERHRHRQRPGLPRLGGLAHAAHRRHDHRGSLNGGAGADRAPQSLPFDPADPKAALTQLPHAAAVFALYGAEAHAEPYIGRTPNLRGAPGTAAAALGQASAPPATGRPRAPHRVAAHRLGVRVAARCSFNFWKRSTARKRLGAHAPAAHPAFVRFLGSNAYPRITVTHRPSQREADWAYGPFPSPRGRRALCRRGAQALSAAPLHRRSGPRSQPSRLRLLRDEDVPGALLQGLHRRALRRRGRGGGELSGHARREPAGGAAHRARRGLGQSRVRVRRRPPCAGAAGGDASAPWPRSWCAR